MNRFGKLSLVIGGYGLALAGAFGASFLENLRQSLLTPQPSQGMGAFSESFVFAGALAFLSIPPTALGFWFLRPQKKLWTFLAYAAPALALTAPLAVLVCAVFRVFTLWKGPWAFLDFLGLVRIFATPVMATAFGILSFIAPEAKTRRALWVSAAIELLVAACIFIRFILFQ